MGCLSSFPEQQKSQLIYEQERKDRELEKSFLDLFLELIKTRENFPITIAVPKDHCGRPTYLVKGSLRSHCPKCSGPFQLFIENKLIKIIERENIIYPLYSKESCYIHTDDNPATSKLDDFNNPEVSTKVKTDENGKHYFDVFGKKLYLSTNLTQLYEKNNYLDLRYFKKYVCEGRNAEQFRLGYFSSHRIDDLNRFNIDNIEYSLHDYYNSLNPLKNFQREKVLIYYRCIKCHLEYHLFLPKFFYYLSFIKKSEESKNQNQNKEETLKENENKI